MKVAILAMHQSNPNIVIRRDRVDDRSPSKLGDGETGQTLKESISAN